MSSYRLIDAEKATYGAKLLCRVLGVPESSYYDWNATGRDRQAERDKRRAARVKMIREAHAASDGTYGSPRVHAELVQAGTRMSRRQVAELMAAEGIVGLTGREHSTTTTRRDRLAAPFPDLVNQRFWPPAPDEIWYGDITYIWLDNRFWFLATVIDAHSKEVLGWSFANHMRTELIIDALHAAVRYRGGVIRPGVIFHSDRGSQYTSNEFGKVCKYYKIRQSMGRRGMCYDNAAAESFFSTLKRELVDRYEWKSIPQLKNGLFSWINTWYNRRRRHSTIGYRTPVEAYQEARPNKAIA